MERVARVMSRHFIVGLAPQTVGTSEIVAVIVIIDLKCVIRVDGGREVRAEGRVFLEPRIKSALSLTCSPFSTFPSGRLLNSRGAAICVGRAE